MKILILTKCRYTNKDLIDDKYGRLFELPYELAQRDHQVLVLCLDYYSGSRRTNKVEQIFNKGSATWLRYNIGFLGTQLAQYLNALFKTVKSFEPDIILGCSDAPHVIISYLLSRITKKKLILDLYDDFSFFKLTRIWPIYPLFKNTLKNTRNIVCISPKLQEKVLTTYSKTAKTVVIPNGIPEKMFFQQDKKLCRKELNLPQNVKLVGTAGALSNTRGIQTLFDAWNLIHEHNRDIHLVLAGPISPNVILPDDAHVHYLGQLSYSTVPILYNSLDVGIICNLNNNFGKHCFPQKAYEMIACNLPVLASDIGAMKKLFSNHPEHLFKHGSHFSLAHNLEKLLSHPVQPNITPLTWKHLAEELNSFLVTVNAS